MGRWERGRNGRAQAGACCRCDCCCCARSSVCHDDPLANAPHPPTHLPLLAPTPRRARSLAPPTRWPPTPAPSAACTASTLAATSSTGAVEIAGGALPTGSRVESGGVCGWLAVVGARQCARLAPTPISPATPPPTIYPLTLQTTLSRAPPNPRMRACINARRSDSVENAQKELALWFSEGLVETSPVLLSQIYE